jgi:hypothetical protein
MPGEESPQNVDDRVPTVEPRTVLPQVMGIALQIADEFTVVVLAAVVVTVVVVTVVVLGGTVVAGAVQQQKKENNSMSWEKKATLFKQELVHLSSGSRGQTLQRWRPASR